MGRHRVPENAERVKVGSRAICYGDYGTLMTASFGSRLAGGRQFQVRRARWQVRGGQSVSSRPTPEVQQVKLPAPKEPFTEGSARFSCSALSRPETNVQARHRGFAAGLTPSAPRVCCYRNQRTHVMHSGSNCYRAVRHGNLPRDYVNNINQLGCTRLYAMKTLHRSVSGLISALAVAGAALVLVPAGTRLHP